MNLLINVGDWNLFEFLVVDRHIGILLIAAIYSLHGLAQLAELVPFGKMRDALLVILKYIPKGIGSMLIAAAYALEYYFVACMPH